MATIDEEGDKFGRGVSCGSLTEYLTCFGVESGIQRQRAMSVVFEAMTFRSAWRKGKDRILPIQRLNSALFIDAEHRGMRRRVQIQSDASIIGPRQGEISNATRLFLFLMNKHAAEEEFGKQRLIEALQQPGECSAQRLLGFVL